MNRVPFLCQILLCLLALAGCVSSPPRVAELSNEELKTRLQASTLVVRPVVRPAKLVERTKSQAVGNFLLSSVVSSVAMSNTGARTPAEFQSNMQIGQEFGKGMNEALPTSFESEFGHGADVFLVKRLSERFPPPSLPSDAETIELVVSSTKWELGYDSFFGSGGYALSSELEVRAIEPGSPNPRTLRSYHCQQNIPERMALDEWRADNYTAIDQAAERISEKCFQLTLMALGIE